MNSVEWESRCRRCGQCCFEKVEHDGRVYYSNTPCDRFDLQTRTCSIYPRRHELKPECMPLNTETLHYGILPADCPYVSDIENYNAPMLWDDET